MEIANFYRLINNNNQEHLHKHQQYLPWPELLMPQASGFPGNCLLLHILRKQLPAD